jgi:hypothetical protein
MDEICVFRFGNNDSGILFLYIISFLDCHQSKTLNGVCMNTCLSVIYSIKKHNLEILAINVSLPHGVKRENGNYTFYHIKCAALDLANTKYVSQTRDGKILNYYDG